MKKTFMAAALAAIMIASAFAGCSNNGTTSETTSETASEYKDGVYRAEFAEFDHGYKEYVEITIADGKISAVEADADSEEGSVKKSADEDYKTAMTNGNKAQGKPETYPSEFYKKLADDLTAKGNVDEVETVAGATNSSASFKKLASAALENAKEGKTEVAVVEAEAAK